MRLDAIGLVLELAAMDTALQTHVNQSDWAERLQCSARALVSA